MPITGEQHELATRLVVDLGYRDVPRPPLRTLQILKNTYDQYMTGRLTEDVASRMDGTLLKEEIQVLLRECRADEVLQDVPLTPSGRGTGSTSSYDGRRNRSSRIITEIPSGVTHTDFQRQLAQTFQDTPSSSRDLRAAHEAMRDPPLAPRPSFNTWHSVAAGTQDAPIFANAQPETISEESSQPPRNREETHPRLQQRDAIENAPEEPAILEPQPIRAQEPRVLQHLPLPLVPPRPDPLRARDDFARVHRDRTRQRRERGPPPPLNPQDGPVPPPNAPNPVAAQGPAANAYHQAPLFAPAVPLPLPVQPPPLTHEELQLALSRENKLNIRVPEPFSGRDRRKWKPFLAECLMTFAAKPNTYGGERPKVVFAVSYLTDLAQKHYITLLQYQPHHPALYNWADFVQEFGNMFGNLNVKLEAERALSKIKMRERDNFHHHLTRFEIHAYESGWNFDALRFALQQSLPRRLKDALANMERRPETYQELRRVLSNLDQSYWEAQADDEEEKTRSNRQPQRTDAANRTSNRGAPTDTGQRSQPPRSPQTRPSGPRPSSNNSSSTNSTANPISAEERERRRREGLCIRCAAAWSPGHTCANRSTAARAVVVLEGEEDPRDDDDEEDSHSAAEEDETPEENLEAIRELPGEA